MEFVNSVFLKGEWWGVFLENELVAASWMHKASEDFYINKNSYWNIKDILDDDLEDVMICGYIYTKEKSEEIYSLLFNIFNMQSLKKEKNTLIHLLSAYEVWALKSIFYQDFKMLALRGLENVTPHYIFIKKASLINENIEEKITDKIDIKNTKAISKMLEKGYIGYKFKDEKIYFIFKN